MRLPVLLALAALLAHPSALAAQDGDGDTPENPDLAAACAAIEDSPVGAWTRHIVDAGNGDLEVTFSLVSRAGDTWYEVLSTTPQGPSVLQLKVPHYPFTPSEVEEAVVKSGSTPAVRLPDSMIDEYRASAAAGPLGDLRAECRKARVVGREEIDVEAGTFEAIRLGFPSTGGEIWVSDAVPFGIVRGSMPGQGSMELAAHGTGAESSITETPVSLGGSGGARSGPGQ